MWTSLDQPHVEVPLAHWPQITAQSWSPALYATVTSYHPAGFHDNISQKLNSIGQVVLPHQGMFQQTPLHSRLFWLGMSLSIHVVLKCVNFLCREASPLGTEFRLCDYAVLYTGMDAKQSKRGRTKQHERNCRWLCPWRCKIAGRETRCMRTNKGTHEETREEPHEETHEETRRQEAHRSASKRKRTYLCRRWIAE